MLLDDSKSLHILLVQLYGSYSIFCVASKLFKLLLIIRERSESSCFVHEVAFDLCLNSPNVEQLLVVEFLLMSEETTHD